MNKAVQLVLLTMLVISASFSQAPPPAGTESRVEVRGEGGVAEAIIAREEGFWDAWKNRRADFFKENLTEESVVVVGTGRKGKSQFVEEISKAECLVREYSLADFKVTSLVRKVFLLTYRAQQRATCGGKELPATVYASSIYMTRRGVFVRVFRERYPNHILSISADCGKLGA
jgi:hypothetical protein